MSRSLLAGCQTEFYLKGTNSLSKRPRDVKQVGMVMVLTALPEGWSRVPSQARGEAAEAES